MKAGKLAIWPKSQFLFHKNLPLQDFSKMTLPQVIKIKSHFDHLANRCLDPGIIYCTAKLNRPITSYIFLLSCNLSTIQTCIELRTFSFLPFKHFAKISQIFKDKSMYILVVISLLQVYYSRILMIVPAVRLFYCVEPFKILVEQQVIDYLQRKLQYNPGQNVWSGSKSVVTFGLIKILTHPCCL